MIVLKIGLTILVLGVIYQAFMASIANQVSHSVFGGKYEKPRMVILINELLVAIMLASSYLISVQITNEWLSVATALLIMLSSVVIGLVMMVVIVSVAALIKE